MLGLLAAIVGVLAAALSGRGGRSPTVNRATVAHDGDVFTDGEELILQKNLFIEYLLPLRNIAPEVMEVYRRHYRNPGASRMPMLAWTRDLPIAGEPRDVVEVVDAYARCLSKSPIPKLFIDAEPAGFLIGAQREFCRAWPNQQVVTVEGSHFLQEDSPDAVGEAAARCVAKVLAGQIA